VSGFPLLLIPLAICNIIAFLMSDVKFDVQLFELPLRSGDIWAVQLGHALVALALLLLMLELLRSARAGGKYVTDHLLSLVIFGGAAAEFVLLPKFGNSTFFLLTLITLVDFLAGLGLRRRPRRVVETVRAEPVPVESVSVEPVPQTVVVRPPPAPAPAPASVIVPPPPPPDPVPLPKPEPSFGPHTDDGHIPPAGGPRVEPVIDGPTHEPHDRPGRPINP
jgi:hypothetical protein